MCPSSGFARFVPARCAAVVCVLCLAATSILAGDSAAEIPELRQELDSIATTPSHNLIASSSFESVGSKLASNEILTHDVPSPERDAIGTAAGRDSEFLRSVQDSAGSLDAPQNRKVALVQMIAPRPGQLTFLVLVFAFFGGRELLRERI